MIAASDSPPHQNYHMDVNVILACEITCCSRSTFVTPCASPRIPQRVPRCWAKQWAEFPWISNCSLCSTCLWNPINGAHHAHQRCKSLQNQTPARARLSTCYRHYPERPFSHTTFWWWANPARVHMRRLQHVLHVLSFFHFLVWNWSAIISFWGDPIPLQRLAPSDAIYAFNRVCSRRHAGTVLRECVKAGPLVIAG